MGRSAKLTSSTEHAKAHEAGATVQLIQASLHKRLGTILYTEVRRWVFHLNESRAAEAELAKLHEQVEAITLDKFNTRMISDVPFLEAIYRAGTNSVLHAALSAQHFCEELERAYEYDGSDNDLLERLHAAAKRGSLGDLTAAPGWDGMKEIKQVRDAIEHPKPGNTYNGDENQWDRVPLAWFLSDRSLKALDRFNEFIQHLEKCWTENPPPARPTTFDAQRGIHSTHNKPRKPTSPS